MHIIKTLLIRKRKCCDGETLTIPATIEDNTVYEVIQQKIKEAGYGVKATIIFEEDT